MSKRIVPLSFIVLASGCVPGAQAAADGFQDASMTTLVLITVPLYFIYLLVALFQFKRTPRESKNYTGAAEALNERNPVELALITKRKALFTPNVQHALFVDLIRRGHVEERDGVFVLVHDEGLFDYEKPFVQLVFTKLSETPGTFEPERVKSRIKQDKAFQERFKRAYLEQGKLYQERFLRRGWFNRQSPVVIANTLANIAFASVGVVFFFAQSNGFAFAGAGLIVSALVMWGYLIQQNVLSESGKKEYILGKALLYERGHSETIENEQTYIFLRAAGRAHEAPAHVNVDPDMFDFYGGGTGAKR
ncbi:hypothetical protein ACE1TF_14830 [Geomicrobium sp. JSM 1781026]|uniref:hypothetical protein n=1 Tax=Geomicrobium sp. JSM 1781026 TaxID=3344580 RepID=UPI0035C06CBF